MDIKKGLSKVLNLFSKGETVHPSASVILLLFLGLITVGYCWFIFLAIHIFLLFNESVIQSALPLISRFAADHVLFWQVLAVLSFIINFFLSRMTAKKNNMAVDYKQMALFHLCWLFLCLLLHAIGILSPFIMRVYIIQ